MIRYQGEEYVAIREFNCRVLSFKNKWGGGYFTVLPLSSLDYRKAYPTKACVKVIAKDNETVFHITDDWGVRKTVYIDNTHAEEIEDAINAAREQQLLSN